MDDRYDWYIMQSWPKKKKKKREGRRRREKGADIDVNVW